MRKILCLVIFLGLLSQAFAFKWRFDQWSAGSYTFELRRGEGDTAEVAIIDIVITDTGGKFDVTTTMTVNQTSLTQSDLNSAAFGGSAVGLLVTTPMIIHGPALMMSPMVLGEEDISVRSEPLSVEGVGKAYMDKIEQIAGLECVVIRLEMEVDDSMNMELAVAEGIPIPCYSRQGEGSDRVEIRLIKAEISQ
jgi:hypothetical protein